MTRGDPRVQYKRTYVLLPPKAGAEWVRAVLAATWDKHRYTVGGSADDACVGNLDFRHVIAVNPDGWGGAGALKEWIDDWYPGVTMETIKADTPEQLERMLSIPEPTPNGKMLVGLHDEAGAYWMQGNGMKGVCLIHHQIQDKAIPLDYRFLRQNDITVIVRLNWGYADGTGTIAPPNKLNDHLAALAITMLGAEGVDYFHAWNEPNNRSEWPRGFTVTKEYALEAYNRLWKMVSPSVKLGLPPLDPYYGPGSNNMDWWTYFLANASGMDAIFLHGGKTQTNDPQSVWSTEKFSDDPLKWQYLNARSIEPYIDKIPSAGLPIFCTEVNPQRMADGKLGWDSYNAQWIQEAYNYLAGQNITGVVFYRYDKAGDQAGFSLSDKPILLDAIKQL